MEPIICLITNNNYYQTRYCIENFTAKTSLKFRLHILDNNSSDEELLKYLESITKDIKKGYLYRQNQELSLSDCYNLLFTTCQDNICILFPVNCIVDNYWLEDLISSLNSVDKAGCVCIKPIENKIDFTPVLTDTFIEENILENVIQTTEHINSVIAVKSEIVSQVGKIDSDLNATGFELSEFALRVKVNGFNNFYIRKQSLFKMPFDNKVLFPKITKENIKKFKETVNLMFKHKRFKK